jgi:outer membrane immunogenic protein
LPQRQGESTVKRLLLASTALAFGGQAFAADMPIKAPRMATPVAYSWSSCYVGGHVGAGRSRTNFADRNVDIGFGPTQTLSPPGGSIDVTGRLGGLGGVQLGCDYQFASGWVVGFAGDFSWANIQGQAIDPFFNGKNGGPLTLASKTDMIASATGRIGYAWDRTLLYAKGGAAHGRMTGTRC